MTETAMSPFRWFGGRGSMSIMTLPSEANARGIREFSPSSGMVALPMGGNTVVKTFRRLMVVCMGLLLLTVVVSTIEAPLSFYG